MWNFKLGVCHYGELTVIMKGKRMTNKRKSDNRMQDVFDSNLWVLSEALKRDTPLAAVREMENVMSKKLGAQVLISIEPAQRGFEFTVRADEGGYATFTTEIDADW